MIVLDEEHVDGARITPERDAHAPWSITCGVYGWMVHTRFFSSQDEAAAELERMREGLEILLSSGDESRFSEFVAQFP
ncbi:MAG: hypothetical protein GY745_13965 [Actinomycetia bacterium]|nr:hypothetical protein [Actinomycetes bacterium]MCP4086142.1 hypothetical protein [Actinomycetes bacterium]